MPQKIKLDGFQDAIADILSEYSDRVDDVLEEAIKDTAKQARKDLRNKSPRSKSRRSGSYAKSWQTQNTGTRIAPGYTVYSSKPGLPHLLEKGHATRNGGRTTPQPHISPVNDSVPDIIEQKIRRALG